MTVSLILGRDIGWGCRCVLSWYDLDLNFDFAKVTLTFKYCLGYISETIRCRKLIRGRDIGLGCRCVISWCNLDLAFDLPEVTLTVKILSGLYLRNHKV